MSGYLRTPISKIMRVTGVKKGGIYHHFDNREALALEAFQHSTSLLSAEILKSIEREPTAKRKLAALIRFPFTDDYWRGGCAIANLAVESDNANETLCAAARKAMAWLIGVFAQVIEEGMRRGEFAHDDARSRAIQIVAELEGGIALSNLYKEPEYLRRIAERLEAEVRAGLPTQT